MYRTNCGLCQTGDLNQFLDLGTSPLADRFPATKDEVEEHFPIRVGMCARCKLVQLMDIVPDDVLYGSDYAFYTSASHTHNPYWFQYARQIEEFEPKKVLEIACNDGSLLNQFSRNLYVVGIDPASGPLEHVAAAIPTKTAAFTAKTAQELVDEHGQFDVVVANNVLAHVSDLEDFVRGLNVVTHRDSVVIVEVQYLGDLVTGNQFDHFYHEHRSFFSVRTLTRLFIGLGFTIFDVQHTPAQGGSIRVFLSKGSFKYQQTDPVAFYKNSEAWLDEWFSMEGIHGRVELISNQLVEILDDNSDKVVAGYGATAKSCTLLNYTGIYDLDWVVDTTPWKQGRFTPGTKIQVLSPKNEPVRPDMYLLLAWNYLGGILKQESEYMADGGKFLVPLPKPVIL